jgi:CheY-like chemotaxis protein
MERTASHQMLSTLAAMRIWLASLRRTEANKIPEAVAALNGLERSINLLAQQATGKTVTPPRPAAASTDPDAGPLSGIAILLIEDEPNMREGLSALLTQLGAHVRAVGNSIAALKRFDEEPPDVIISDLRIEGEDGGELLREIRRLPQNQGRSVPAIALTASASAVDRDASRHAGFAFHLVKPPSLEELMAAVLALAPQEP